MLTATYNSMELRDGLPRQPRKVAGVAAEPDRGVFRRKASVSVGGRHAFSQPTTEPGSVAPIQVPIPLSHGPAPRLSGVFTFIEVLFSVIIIGVGFIMVAAMFPIAIEQSQTNLSESV